MEEKGSASEEETKTDSESDDALDEVVLEGEILEEPVDKEAQVRCRCYGGCFILWAFIIYLLTDYYVSKIYITY
jgi:hypothetical protein